MPFLINSRRPLSFSSLFVCVRSVFQIATNNGWCFSLKARSVATAAAAVAAAAVAAALLAAALLAAALLAAVAAALATPLFAVWFCGVGFSSRCWLWVWLASFELRDDRCSWWELKYIYNFYLNNYMFICFLFLHRFAITIWKNIKRKKIVYF